MPEEPQESVAAALAVDDECRADDSAQCALNALQRRALKLADLDVKASNQAEDRKESAEAVGSCAVYGCVGFVRSHSCQCNSACKRYHSCCDDYDAKCGPTPPPKMRGQTKDGIDPPKSAFTYNGIAWPPFNVSVPAGVESHIFAIGDWGGMDGSFKPTDGFPQMNAYPGGNLPGPHVFPRSRIDCKHGPLTDCYFPGRWCDPVCGFAKGVDDQAQLLVADQFKKLAAKNDPQYVLNVGDNFYWGGIAKNCGHPMEEIHLTTQHQFNTIFNEVYNGPGVDGKRWLSTLGNHDWGGRQFNAAWDQQIAYTWANDRWMLPAAYWSQLIHYPDYTVEVFMLDSNFNDAEEMDLDPEHNICGAMHNIPGADCSANGGPKDLGSCLSWFKALWAEEQVWLEKRLAESRADWSIAVTHFPCDHSAKFWRDMHYKYGLDLLVTGHRHDQELWKANQRGYKGMLGGLTCFVTGGGGGITSEESIYPGTPTHDWPNVGTQYGFFDLTISKEKIKVDSIDWMGNVVDSTVAYPKENPMFTTTTTQEPGSCAKYGCGGFVRSHQCQCNSKCKQYNSCCADYDSKCGR